MHELDDALPTCRLVRHHVRVLPPVDEEDGTFCVGNDEFFACGGVRGDGAEGGGEGDYEGFGLGSVGFGGWPWTKVPDDEVVVV